MCASWAIWNEDNQKDTSVIETKFKELNTNYVFVGLNISRLLGSPPWSNFHGGMNDRKLMYACNDTKLRGAYVTDIFKDLPIARASEVEMYIKQNPKVLKENIDSFRKEMDDIKISKDTVVVVLGADSSLLLKCFNEHLKDKIKGKVFNIRHYSSRGRDEEWVNELWGRKEIGINKIFKKEERRKSEQNKA